MSRMDEAKHVDTVARVQVTLEIPVPSGWGADCTLGQVYVQAKDAAVGILRRHFNLGDGAVIHNHGGDHDDARIVGEPVILGITNTGRAR